jgi:hypothetical protein
MTLFMRLAVWAGLSFATIGCGLLNDATKFSVDTEWQTFTLDSAQLGLSVPGGTTVPAVNCTAANDICAQASSGFACGSGNFACNIHCGTSSTCEISAEGVQGTPIDLSKKISGQADALSKVSLQRMVYNTDENTLNIDTPEFVFYVGPQGATKITDGGVVRLGTMPTIPKGTTPNEIIAVTDEGNAALTTFVKNYQTPFQLLGKVALSFASGAPVPQGRITLKLKAYFEIEPVK